MTVADLADLVPVVALERWLGDRLPGDAALTARRVTTGHSNELFEISRGGETWMLRRPPRVANSPTAHDMARENRVLTALDHTNVPHATLRGFCSDTGVIGTAFLLTERVDGRSLYDHLPLEFDDQRWSIAKELVTALAALHAVDWRLAGLEQFGRPDRYTERQVARWTKQLASYAFREVPELDEVSAWLADTCPGTSSAALIHGDYGLHNVLFASTCPPCLTAILDWETSTIGDPLCDIGYLLKDWLEPGEEEWADLTIPYGMQGYPPRAQLISWYEESTATSIDDAQLRWYRALGEYKIAVILEGSYARYRAGSADDPFFATLEDRVPLLARHALAISRDQA